MKTTKTYAKKTLSVLMAVMMLMSAWVFVPGEHNHASAVSATTISGENITALNTIGTFDTNVATITDLNWAYNGDNQDNEPNIYKNILYASDCNVVTASTGSVNLKDSGAATIEWYHGTYIFLYDGVTTPQAGVMVAMKPRGSSYNIRMYSSYIASGAGLSLAHNWYASDGRANFMWVISAPGNQNAATNNGSINSTYCWTVNSNTWFANRLQFTDAMSDNEFYRDITVTWGWSGNQRSQGTGSVYTYSKEATNHIYVVNYKPLKAALNEALGTGTYSISTLKNNAAKYTTDSIAEYVAAVKDLIAAKPNNYVNDTQNDYIGYANAASAAVTRFNNAKANLTLQTYTVTFKDVDSNEVGTHTYNYGASVDCAALAANYPNTIKQVSEQQHQTYSWDTSKYVTTVTDDITISEVANLAVDHSYGAWSQNADDHSRTCTVCGYVQTQAHVENSGTIDKEETCTENGIKTYDCQICGKVDIRTETIDKINGHDFSGAITIKEDGENGTHWKKCVRFEQCGTYGWPGLDEGESVDHNWDKNNDGLVDAGDAETKASTCIEAGYEKYTCKDCGATWTKVLPLVAHKATATAAKDVTNQCGGDGNVAFWTCSVCNKIFTDANCTAEVTDYTDNDSDGIPDALETKGPEHNFTGAYVPATGGKDGTHYRQCTRFTQCGAYGLMVDGKAVTGATEKHTWGDPKVTDATCEKEGKEVYTCTSGECGQTYEKTLDKAAHSMTKIAAVAAVCGTPGNNEYYSCSTCNKYYKDEAGTTVTTVEAEKIPALQHKWSAHHDYDTLKDPATCVAPAVYNNHCDYCKVELTGEHPYGEPDPTGHDYTGNIQYNGNKTHAYLCKNGCKTYGNVADCEYKVTQDVASTCKTEGYTLYECETCGNGYSETKALDPNNHTDEGTKTVGALDAKCNSNGYTGDVHCLGCDAVIEKGTVITADPKVHPHENMKDYEGKVATCQDPGYSAYRYCDQCGTYEIEKVSGTLKAHKFTKYVSNGDGTHTAVCDTCADGTEKATETKDCSGGTANCVDKKVCTECKVAYGEVDSANHKTVVTVPKVDSTCQTEGTEAYRKCTACNKNVETPEVIEKKDHIYGAWSKVDGEDKHTRSCTTCKADVAEVATETLDCAGGTAYCNKLAECATCKATYGEFDPDNHSTEANHLDGAYDATCQAPGFTGNYYYDCCNALKQAGTATEQLAHTFDIEVEGTRVAATCIAKGEVTYKCSTCVESEGVAAATQKKELAIDTNNHATPNETVVKNQKAATCEEDGHTGDVYYKCCYVEGNTAEQNKKALKEKGTTIKANGQHVYGEYIPEYMAEITTDADGVKTLGKKTTEPDYDTKIEARRADNKWYHFAQCTICGVITEDACYTYKHTFNCVDTDKCEICKGLCSLRMKLFIQIL